ncbi:hypothetical protein [Mangrovibacillus cuniculi]|uniref:Uncharacterized protein n=1 Tax=Mangrovibacillus cuniculi TaxID=2593652 RepID=A0A7S8CCN1_9BACI|nr:hypothetical protein [Mangrovibacillus cuniculi]QPC47338.1 hypothetical protein G8O30_10445 [Mangrovibacillus cuniculi]
MNFLLGLFLYFPEDKTEYIPAGITMAIFAVLAIIVFRIILRVNRKQEQEAKEYEQSLKKQSNKR